MKPQLEIFTTEATATTKAIQTEAQTTETKKRKEEILQTFIVHSAHLEVWADVSPRTAQREMRKIRKSFKMRDRAKVTFVEVADYYGWRGDRLLKELNHRKLTTVEKIREKL